MMKKILMTLLLLVAGLQTMQAQEAYATLSYDYKTLTFYYDKQKASRNRIMDIGPFSWLDDRGWDDYCYDDITTVVFANSFANYTGLTSTAYWFADCENLTTIEGIENLKTDNVTDMGNMFSYCESLTSLDLSSFNTAKVTNMSEMFYGCSSLTSLDLSGFNTEKVTDMSYMFQDCGSLKSLDLSNFNTANVTYMSKMFHDCSSLTSLDLSNFNTANVTNMWNMFSGCSSLTSLDLSGFNTANVTNMYGMFYGCSALTTIYAGDDWSVDNLEYSSAMFDGCESLVGGNGTTYSSLHIDSDYACIDKPGQRGYLTYKPREQPYAVLDGNTLIFYYDTHKESRGGMSIGPFMYNSRLNVPTTSWYPQSGIITTVRFDDSFADYTELASTDCWFFGCTNLTTIDGIENLKTDNVVRMGRMFHLCRSLKTLDLSGFNTEKVTDMRDMFRVCSALTTIYVGDGWSTGQVTNGTDMFSGCTSLVGGNGTTYDADHTDYTYARLDKPGQPGYFTSKKGDTNNDGKVDIADVVTILNAMASDSKDPIFDVNEDTKVDIADVVSVLNLMANQ